VREEHPTAAVAVEAQFIQNLADIDVFLGISILIPLPYQEAELLPFVGDHLTAAEAANWNDHLLIVIR
jgi:hypothetical protein